MSDTAKKIENLGRYKTGEISPIYGKNNSEETRDKISASKKGKNHHNFVSQDMKDQESPINQ
jgi:hypothetical protein